MTGADYPATGPTMYLSGSVCAELLEVAGRPDVGMLAQPGTSGYPRRYAGAFGHWAADNGCFAELKGKPFDVERWWRWVEELPHRGCLFVTAPDVVGDPVATWARSELWLERIRGIGLPAGYVAQDGSEADIPWRAFDALFIGGSDEWKMGPAVLELLAEARARGKWCHVGRVNTAGRWEHFSGRADSVDGTMLAFGPKVNTRRLLRWLDRAQVAELELEPAR
jgi:hypothetical protein